MSLLDWLEGARKAIGMDANSFYTVLLTFLSTIVVALIPVFSKCIKSKTEHILWDLQSKNKEEFFYVFVMFGELGLTVIGTIVYTIILMVVHVIFKISNQYACLIDVFCLCFFIITSVVEIKIILNRISVKKRTMGQKKYVKSLICFPVVIYNIFMLQIFEKYATWYIYFWENCGVFLDFILCTIIIIVEVWAICTFRGYTVYKYASARMYLNDGTVVECEDISKVKRRYSALIKEDEGVQVRIKYSDIKKVEYYGGMKIVLTEEYAVERLFKKAVMKFKKKATSIFKRRNK